MALRMKLYFLHMLFIFHPTLGEFPLMCPSKPHWNFRAQDVCQNLDDYRCLWDKNNKKFIEQCEGYDIQMKGFRKVIEGDITAGECTENRYQPRMWTTKGNFDCVLEKSLCNENGQIVYDDGDGVTDRTCGCNSKAGYVFLQKPKHLCYCEPTIEDCTCIKKKCPPEHAVDPEYECRNIHQWKLLFNCKEIFPIVPTTVPPVTILQSTEEPEKAISNKNKAVIVVAIGIVIFIFIGIGVIAFFIDTETKMEIFEQDKLKEIEARKELERDLEEKERQYQEDKIKERKAREELEMHLQEKERHHQEEKLKAIGVEDELKINLKMKERQHQEDKLKEIRAREELERKLKEKEQKHQEEKLKAIGAEDELKINLKMKERQHQEDTLKEIRAREELERKLKEKEQQHQEDKLKEIRAREELERKLKEKEQQHQEQNEAIANLQQKIVSATKYQQVVHINDIGKNKSKANANKIGFSVVKRYTVDMMNIHHMTVSPDGSLWIGDNTSEKVQHIKLTGDSITTMSTFNIQPYCLGISPSGFPLIKLKGASTLSIINELTGQIMDSKYSIAPWILTCFHITADNNVIAGGINGDKSVVIVMDKSGKHLSKYEKDKDAPLLTYPDCIATTRNGYMFVTDGRSDAWNNRLVVIKPGSRDVIYYTGNDEITTENKPFKPISILVTPNDNVLMKNYNTPYLYIMNNEGAFITCFDLASIGIDRPYSLALSPAGNIYVGRVNAVNAPKDAISTLYELEYSGV